MLQTLHAGRSSIQDIVSLTPPTTPNQIHPNETPSSPALTPASALTETHDIQDQRPDIVTLEGFDADHTLAWNSDPERWRAVVSGWLTSQVAS